MTKNTGLDFFNHERENVSAAGTPLGLTGKEYPGTNKFTAGGTMHAPSQRLDHAKQDIENMLNIRLLNINQVCEALNMSRVKVYELINRKRLKSIKIGSRRLVSTRALSDFINRLED